MKTCAVFLSLLLVLCGRAFGAEEGCRTGPCHRDVGQEETVHEPVLYGECRTCHKGSVAGHPDRAGEEFIFSLGGGAELCYSCHSEVREEGSRALSVHGPVRAGECLACHLPHSSPSRSLLRTNFPEDTVAGNPLRLAFKVDDYSLCWECHDVYIVMLAKTDSRTAFREGSSNLHFLHLRGEKAYTCLACHPPHHAQAEHLVGRKSGWTEDFVNFSPTPGGGTCAPGCHVPRSYQR